MSVLERGAVIVAGIIFLAVLTDSCNAEGRRTATSDYQSAQRSDGSACITAASFGSEWPLTVAGAQLACRNSAVTASIGGMEYAVNGTAKSRGYPDIEPYWMPGEHSPKKNIGPLIDYGLSLCTP